MDQSRIRNFSHHRPHRPRQVDAGRPHPRAHAHGRRARDARPAPRLHGPRARARHHDQGPGGARLLHGQGRPDLPAEPHRHARPRGLHLRGVALAWPRARARCWSSTPPRASRPRRVANTYLAVETGLEIIPCLNKIDLPGAEPERVAGEVDDLIGDDPTRPSCASAARPARASTRSSRRIVARVPPPERRPDGAAARAHLRLRVRPVPRRDRLRPRRRRRASRKGEAIRAMATGAEADDRRASASSPRSMTPAESSRAGEVGYLITGIKDVHAAARRRHADHAEQRGHRAAARLPRGQADGLLRPLPDRRRPATRTCATRWRSSRSTTPRCIYEPETSDALGFGFRCGFLGLLHMDIVRSAWSASTTSS